MNVEIRSLRPDDDRGSLRCGDEALDLFFHRYAGQNQFRHHIGVTYVAASGNLLHGFLTVAPASLAADDLPGGRRLPPYPVPVLRLARLAVALDAQGRGLGHRLLKHAIELAERMRDELGCVGLVVDAKPGAVEFYRSLGFLEIEIVAGAGEQRPRPSPMFLPLGAVPRRPSP
jgi:GNAT superfamily N-acetyltransferase